LYKGSLRRHVTPGHGTHLSLGQHRHCFDAGQRPLRRPEALKAEHGPGQALDPAVILLDPVIEPAPTPVPGEAPQLTLLLHLAERAGIALEAVGDDLARVAGVLPAESPLEEALGCLLVPLGTEQPSCAGRAPLWLKMMAAQAGLSEPRIGDRAKAGQSCGGLRPR
jgi:hypothetical protein